MKNLVLFITVLFFSFAATDAYAQNYFKPVDFNGIWGGGVPITVTGNSVVVDMSIANRPNGTGTVVDDNTIRVNHPDDKTYTGKLVSINRIEWGSNNFWDRATKKPEVTATDFNGLWGGGVPITVTGNSVVIDMSSAGRPNATGTVIAYNKIRVTHPDDKTYVGTLVSKNRIEWGPNNFWDRAVTPPPVECNFFWSSAPAVDRGNTKVATGTINGVNYTYTSSQPINFTNNIHGYEVFPAGQKIPNQKCIRNDKVSKNTIEFAEPIKDPVLVFASIGNEGVEVPIAFKQNVEILFDQGLTKKEAKSITGREGFAVVRIKGTHKTIEFEYTADEYYANFLFGAAICKE